MIGQRIRVSDLKAGMYNATRRECGKTEALLHLLHEDINTIYVAPFEYECKFAGTLFKKLYGYSADSRIITFRRYVRTISRGVFRPILSKHKMLFDDLDVSVINYSRIPLNFKHKDIAVGGPVDNVFPYPVNLIEVPHNEASIQYLSDLSDSFEDENAPPDKDGNIEKVSSKTHQKMVYNSLMYSKCDNQLRVMCTRQSCSHFDICMCGSKREYNPLDNPLDTPDIRIIRYSKQRHSEVVCKSFSSITRNFRIR